MQRQRKCGSLAPLFRILPSLQPGYGIRPPYRPHSMATNSSHEEPLQPVPPAVGIAPVMSSRSILWNDSALLNACYWQ